MHKKKIVFVTSDLYYVKGFLSRQIKLASTKYEVYLIVNADMTEAASAIGKCGATLNFDIQRKISILKDLTSLVRLLLFFYKIKPDIVHSTTPKSGLLAMLAAFFARVPLKLHTFTGQVWQTKKGSFRLFLIFLDKLTARCADFVLTDSHSQRQVLIDHMVVSSQKSGVLGNGSICGVDLVRFNTGRDSRYFICEKYSIPTDSVILLYMARFTVDKGAVLMADAFAKIVSSTNYNTHLLMIGPDEDNLMAVIDATLSAYAGNYSILSYTDTPEKFFQAADIFCLPSYREGFPMVLLNSAACGLPVVASRIYGSSDAVIENETALMFEAGNLKDFSEKLLYLISDENLRKSFSKKSREFAVSNFSEDFVNSKLMELYLNKSI